MPSLPLPNLSLSFNLVNQIIIWTQNKANSFNLGLCNRDVDQADVDTKKLIKKMLKNENVSLHPYYVFCGFDVGENSPIT